MTKSQTLSYTGNSNVASLIAFCKEKSQGCYVVYSTVFGEALVSKFDKLPASKHAPSDYPNGYFHDGKHCKWSESRLIAAQNAGQTRD